MAKKVNTPDTDIDSDYASKLVKTFGDRLREARIAKDLSQTEFSSMAGISRAYLYELESGSANVTLKTIALMSEVLGLHPRDFFPRASTELLSPHVVEHVIPLLAKLSHELQQRHRRDAELKAELAACEKLIAADRALSDIVKPATD